MDEGQNEARVVDSCVRDLKILRSQPITSNCCAARCTSVINRGEVDERKEGKLCNLDSVQT